MGLILAWPAPAGAVDTTETYEPGGLTDFEGAVGYEGLGPGHGDRHLHASYQFGVGITDWFSGRYFGEGKFFEQLTDGETTYGFGLLFTPIDTYHLDLDLLMDIGFVSTDRAYASPGFELNVDGHPDQSSFGLFLQGGAHMNGRGPSLDGTLRSRSSLSVPYALGSYYSVADGHQLLLLLDFTTTPDPEPDERGFEVGNLALGYNVMIHDQVELLHEVFVDIPQSGDRIAYGLWFGFIAAVR